MEMGNKKTGSYIKNVIHKHHLNRLFTQLKCLVLNVYKLITIKTLNQIPFYYQFL